MFLENTDMCKKYFSIQRINYICSLIYCSLKSWFNTFCNFDLSYCNKNIKLENDPS